MDESASPVDTGEGVTTTSEVTDTGIGTTATALCQGDLQLEDDQAMADIAHCTKFEGSLYIGGDIVQIDLPLLVEVTENIRIYGYDNATVKMNSLTGLPSLTTVGGDLRIEWLHAEYVDGLEALTTVGGMLVLDESNYKRIDGLNALVSVGTLDISGNILLESLNGFENLTEIDRVTISWNTRLCQSLVDAFYAKYPDAVTVLSYYNNESC